MWRLMWSFCFLSDSGRLSSSLLWSALQTYDILKYCPYRHNQLLSSVLDRKRIHVLFQTWHYGILFCSVIPCASTVRPQSYPLKSLCKLLSIHKKSVFDSLALYYWVEKGNLWAANFRSLEVKVGRGSKGKAWRRYLTYFRAWKWEFDGKMALLREW